LVLKAIPPAEVRFRLAVPSSHFSLWPLGAVCEEKEKVDTDSLELAGGFIAPRAMDGGAKFFAERSAKV